MYEAPKDLTALEYARHILEEVLGWPAKGNLEMMADCITSVSKSRKIPLVKAHGYMQRAIELAKKQGVPVDKWFFMEGVYTTIRPEAKNVLPLYKPIDRKALEEHQKTPEYQEALAEFRACFKEIMCRTKIPSPGKVEK